MPKAAVPLTPAQQAALAAVQAARETHEAAHTGADSTASRDAALRQAADQLADARLAFARAFDADTPEHASELGELCLEEAGARFQLQDDQVALGLDRLACDWLRSAMLNQVTAANVLKLVVAYRALAAAAAVTNRTGEARLAAGTGLALAATAVNQWPEVADFDSEQAAFEDLCDRLGGDCTVFASDDPLSWPFED